MVDPIAVKEVVIDGKVHQVKVYPPSPIDVEPEVVWAKPKHGAHISRQKRIAMADGHTEIITTLVDQPR